MSKEDDKVFQELFEEMIQGYRPSPLTYPEFLGLVLRVGIGDEEGIKELIEEEKGKPCAACCNAAHDVCDHCGLPLCDDPDCVVTSGKTGVRAYLMEDTRYHKECASKEVGYDL